MSLGAVAARNGYTVTTIPTNIDAVNCVGTETSIFDCTTKYGGASSTCEPLADAGIICQGKWKWCWWQINIYYFLDTSVTFSNCTHGELRLTGGQVPTEGRVEICYNGVWGSICDNGWNTVDANVVCDQLGYYPSGMYY